MIKADRIKNIIRLRPKTWNMAKVEVIRDWATNSEKITPLECLWEHFWHIFPSQSHFSGGPLPVSGLGESWEGGKHSRDNECIWLANDNEYRITVWHKTCWDNIISMFIISRRKINLEYDIIPFSYLKKSCMKFMYYTVCSSIYPWVLTVMASIFCITLTSYHVYIFDYYRFI